MASELVSIGLPVRNGEATIGEALASLMGQEYENVEIVVSDNASDDGTEEICRAIARTDKRIRYHRQATNLGIDGNFTFVINNARARFFKWVGHDDLIDPSYVARCLDVLVDDPRLVLVTTQQEFRMPDGQVGTAPYHGTRLQSEDPVVRFSEFLRLLNSSHLLIDPMYGLVRRAAAVEIPRKVMLRSDQIWATRLALAGPWSHVNEVLAFRGWPDETRAQLVRRMGIARWNVRVATALQARELLALVAEVDLTPMQKRAALRAVAVWYAGWHRRRVVAGGWRAVGRASERWSPRRVAATGSHVS